MRKCCTPGSLQKFNVNSCQLFETKRHTSVSVGMYMNNKGTRKILNVAFKQFQRLPDWQPVQVTAAKAPTYQPIDRNSQALRQPGRRAGDASGSQALAE